MNSLGFKDIKNLSNKEFTLSNGNKVKDNVYIGYKTIDYYMKKRGLIGIFIGGFNDDNAYKELFLTAENLNSSNNIYDEIAEIIKGKIDGSKINDFSDGHYIVLAGVNKEDIVNIDMEEFDDWTDEDLNDIRIYVCDSAYYHHRNANKRTCTTEYTYNDFTDKKKAGADSFWIYTKDADATYDNDDHWEYRNKNYTETFDPQTYTEYTERGNKEINNPYGVYHWEESTWEYLD